MRKLLLIWLLTLVNVPVFSQRRNDTLFVKPGIVTISLLEYIPLPINLNSSNINVGKETFLGGRESIYINLGVIHSWGPNAWPFTETERNRGIKVQAEGRHYLGRTRIVEPMILLMWPHIFQFKSLDYVNSGYYTALWAQYSYTETDRKQNAGTGFSETYLVARDILGLTAKVGYQCVKPYGLVVDFAIGLGGGFVQSRSYNKVFLNGQFQPDGFDDGSSVFPYVNYHLRLGFGGKSRQVDERRRNRQRLQ